MLTRHADPPVAGGTHRSPVQIMLRSLPAQHREILVATYFQGRTTREAARELGLAPATARIRLYHAMRGLSRMVAAYRLEHADRFAAGPADEIAAPRRWQRLR